MQNMPIGIFRGDDTDAFSYQTIVGTINTDLDLTGCRAVFRYLNFSMEFDPIPEDRKLTIVIPADETKKFPPGLGYASLRVYDSEDRLKTFSNRIMVFVATKTPMFGSDEFEVDFNVRASLEPLKFFVGPNPDDFDEYRGYVEKVIDRASAAKYGLAILLDAIDSDLGAADGVAATPVAVKAAYAAIIEKLTDDYYTAEQTDEAIDRVAAYYITRNAAGGAFETKAQLDSATVFYSGGKVRTPTRNDYCVVLADETHDNAEYRYIYAVADGETTGIWQAQYPVEGVMTVDSTVTKNSQNPVASSGIWSAIWGALSALPTGFASLYDWVVAQLRLKRDLTDMACTVDVAGIPQIGSGKFVVTSPTGTSTTLTPFESGNVRGWGWYMTYPYIFARAADSYDIIFGSGISDIIPLNMTVKTQTVTYNGNTWTVDAFTGATMNTRLANMTDIPAPSTSTPQMDGTGAAGTSAAFARGDHVHPTDTSRMAATATGADIPLAGGDETIYDVMLTKADDIVEVDGQTMPLSDGIVEVNTKIVQHADDTTIHVTAAEKSTWNGKQDALSSAQLANIAAVSDALAFDATHSYAAGDPVVYNGTLYTFTATHTGAWTGSDVSAVDIIARLANVVHKTGAEEIAGTKTFTDGIYMNGGLDVPWIYLYQRYFVTDAGAVYIPNAESGTLALTADLRYALTTKTINNGAVTLDDRAINAVAVSSSLASLTVNFPTATSGKARDFGLRLTVASGITTAPELALPQGVVCENADGEAPEIGADGAATILYFTETASGVFLVKGEVVQTIS